MRDFPGTLQINPESAFSHIQSRYQAIEQIYGNQVELIRSGHPELSKTFYGLCKITHRILFNGILSNAGEFRLPSEPNHGYVGFGKNDVRQPTGAQFNGTPAEQIDKQVEETCSLLSWEDKDPVRTSAIFYQRFVRIHPFYDANGRVGRAVVTIYLRLLRILSIMAKTGNNQ